MARHHRPPCPRPSPTASRPTFTPARHDQIPLAAAYPDHVSQDGGTAAPARPALAAALGEHPLLPGTVRRRGRPTFWHPTGAVCTCSGTRGCTCVPGRGRTRWRYVDDG